VAVLGLITTAGCGSSLLGTSSTTGAAPATSAAGARSTSTTVPVNGEVAVAFPVVACVDPANGGAAIRSRSGWNPSILLAPIPTSLVGRVSFYTDGIHIVLGPTGWTCARVIADGSSTATTTTTTTPGGGPATTVPASTPDAPTSGQYAAMVAPGATTLVVYPANDPNPPTSGAPVPGTDGVFATFASTGTDAGVDLVCPFAPLPGWQSQQAGCSTSKPGGETSDVRTPDVTGITDPPGVVGSLASSGGQGTVTGVVLFPQIPSAISYGSPLPVAAESCALSDATVCPTVLSDFSVREFPVPGTS
jgi:hypothetical protein